MLSSSAGYQQLVFMILSCQSGTGAKPCWDQNSSSVTSLDSTAPSFYWSLGSNWSLHAYTADTLLSPQSILLSFVFYFLSLPLLAPKCAYVSPTNILSKSSRCSLPSIHCSQTVSLYSHWFLCISLRLFLLTSPVNAVLLSQWTSQFLASPALTVVYSALGTSLLA